MSEIADDQEIWNSLGGIDYDALDRLEDYAMTVKPSKMVTREWVIRGCSNKISKPFDEVRSYFKTNFIWHMASRWRIERPGKGYFDKIESYLYAIKLRKSISKTWLILSCRRGNGHGVRS